MNKKILILPLILIVVAVVILSNHLSLSLDANLVLSGNFEIDDAALSFRVPGVISSRPVDEGQKVEAGTLIATLDREELTLAVHKASAFYDADKALLSELVNGSRAEEKQLAQAQLEMAKATLRQLEAGVRPQELKTVKASLQQTEAMVNKAFSAMTEAQKDAKRFSRLFSDKAVSEKDYLSVKTRSDAAQANYNEAIARHEAAKQQLSLANEGARSEEIEKAQAAVKAASATLDLIMAGPRSEKIQQATAKAKSSEASLEQAKLALSYAELHSPVSGTVLAKAAEVGEFVRQGQTVVTIGNLENLYLRVYVSERNLERIKLGQSVSIATDGHSGETFSGKVVFISDEAEFTPKTVQTHEERVKLVYRVKIAVENKDQKLKPGMPADAVIQF